MQKNAFMVLLTITLSAVLSSCASHTLTQSQSVPSASATFQKNITEEEVIAVQKAWGDAIVAIGKAYLQGEDYKTMGKDFVNKFYGYDQGKVLFKPTKSSRVPFRLTKESAISYFVTGLQSEDHGFALQPWSKIEFENLGIISDSDSATAMGTYYFTDANSGNETRVKYTFEYFKDENGKLRIEVHHSSMPYTSKH